MLETYSYDELLEYAKNEEVMLEYLERDSFSSETDCYLNFTVKVTWLYKTRRFLGTIAVRSFVKIGDDKYKLHSTVIN